VSAPIPEPRPAPARAMADSGSDSDDRRIRTQGEKQVQLLQVSPWDSCAGRQSTTRLNFSA
jgi:hypothetical protein